MPEEVMADLWKGIKDGFPELGFDTIETDSIEINGPLAFMCYNDSLRHVITASISIHCAQTYYYSNNKD